MIHNQSINQKGKKETRKKLRENWEPGSHLIYKNHRLKNGGELEVEIEGQRGGDRGAWV